MRKPDDRNNNNKISFEQIPYQLYSIKESVFSEKLKN